MSQVYLWQCPFLFNKCVTIIHAIPPPETFVIPRLKLKMFGERSFSFCGPKTWDSLPKNLREKASLDTFKRRLKLEVLAPLMGHLGYCGCTINAYYCHFVILNSFLVIFMIIINILFLRLQSFEILSCTNILSL